MKFSICSFFRSCLYVQCLLCACAIHYYFDMNVIKMEIDPYLLFFPFRHSLLPVIGMRPSWSRGMFSSLAAALISTSSSANASTPPCTSPWRLPLPALKGLTSHQLWLVMAVGLFLYCMCICSCEGGVCEETFIWFSWLETMKCTYKKRR